jgi:transposase InsO family protein
MAMWRRHKVKINLKKLIRIKRDHKLVTAVRKPKKFRAIFKKGEEHKVAPNLLKRDFVPASRRTVYSTDITELIYRGGKKAYLSAMKDLATNEIVHFNILERPTNELVTAGLEDLFGPYRKEVRVRMIIHSDQGFHYTSYSFRTKLLKLGIRQSMSRKGNCLDNAPIESFFGHLKDDLDYKACKNFAELRKMVSDYIDYYNNDRPQWGLQQKTPAEAGVKLGPVY